MTITQFFTIILVLVFLYVSFLQWRNARKWREILNELSKVTVSLAEVVEQETAVVAAKENEIQALQEIIKELDAENAFNKCKKDGV